MILYYRGDAYFRERGRPSTYFRLLGRVLVVLTVVLFASGILAHIGPSAAEPAALMTHQVSSISG